MSNDQLSYLEKLQSCKTIEEVNEEIKSHKQSGQNDSDDLKISRLIDQIGFLCNDQKVTHIVQALAFVHSRIASLYLTDNHSIEEVAEYQKQVMISLHEAHLSTSQMGTKREGDIFKEGWN